MSAPSLAWMETSTNFIASETDKTHKTVLWPSWMLYSEGFALQTFL